MQNGGFTSEVQSILEDLTSGLQETLGSDLVGLYLRGSLALGDFDPGTSDVDFFAVTEKSVSETQFAALKAWHSRLAASPNRYGAHLEGAYLGRDAARRFEPGKSYPTIARGEELIWKEHGSNWLLERWALREHGVTLTGPAPETLFDPVNPDEMRAAIRERLRDWVEFARTPDDPAWQAGRNHTAYVVETMCRALCSLALGGLPSKPRAVAWALETLPGPWRALVARSRAWHEDPVPDPSLNPEVMAFVLWTASRSEVRRDSWNEENLK